MKHQQRLIVSRQSCVILESVGKFAVRGLIMPTQSARSLMFEEVKDRDKIITRLSIFMRLITTSM